MPRGSTISRAVLGNAPDVRLYIGSPEMNSSGIAFPEARLVWSPAAPDWQTAISAMPVDPTATHYTRRIDELPLRSEQHITDISTLEQLLDLKHNQVVDWIWIPADEINVQPENWSYEGQKLNEYLRQWRGKKTQLFTDK